ncbi:5-dehydro-2-deoxygluconokinase [Rhodobacteraceae bacterium R_SAG10]|nr:5-dehydro-2-deoxygluconokinase [Rhodobacteraceae bacterium R_SAG10]
MADLARIQGKRFVVLGRGGMDIYPDPPGTKTEDATRFFACLGGSSANIGVAIVRQGGNVELVTRVSDDAVGRFVLNELAKYGIDTRHVKPVSGEFRTSLAVVESRVQDHQSVLYRNGAADFEMTTKDVEAVDFGRASALIVTGTVFAAEPSRAAAFRAFELAQSAGLPIIFDVDYRPYSWTSGDVAAQTYARAAALCDIIIGNDDEFGIMAGGTDMGLELARDLAASTAAIVVYKRGEKGAIAFADTAELHTGIYPVTALKPTGAGDAFMGGFISALADGRALKDCVLRGSAAAAIVVSKVGCAPAMPTTAQLEKFLATHPGPTES